MAKKKKEINPLDNIFQEEYKKQENIKKEEIKTESIKEEEYLFEPAYKIGDRVKLILNTDGFIFLDVKTYDFGTIKECKFLNKLTLSGRTKEKIPCYEIEFDSGKTYKWFSEVMIDDIIQEDYDRINAKQRELDEIEAKRMAKLQRKADRIKKKDAIIQKRLDREEKRKEKLEKQRLRQEDREKKILEGKKVKVKKEKKVINKKNRSK